MPSANAGETAEVQFYHWLHTRKWSAPFRCTITCVTIVQWARSHIQHHSFCRGTWLDPEWASRNQATHRIGYPTPRNVWRHPAWMARRQERRSPQCIAFGVMGGEKSGAPDSKNTPGILLQYDESKWCLSLARLESRCVNCCWKVWTVCQSYTPLQQQNEFLKQLKTPHKAWAIVRADIITLEWKDYLKTVDHFSAFIEADRLRTLTSRDVILKFCMQFARFGAPRVVKTDNAGQFTLEEFCDFSTRWRFNHRTSSPHHPRATGRNCC